ncbi:MAG: FAD-dependent oxidoreductase [Rubripirellula sp.]|nr:FAD-dependent oxidoreductase [Rubripirellula sp.]
MTKLNRREWIGAILGPHVAASVGCSPLQLPPAGELKSTNFRLGHLIRDRQMPQLQDDQWQDVPIVIIGGGIAGLSAAWRLLRAGVKDFVILELEDLAGGTARGGTSGSLAYPWGAHYIPVPMPENQPLIQLLEEMKVVRGREADGSPVVGEQFLCRDPQERLFYDGEWHEGIYPYKDASDDDLRQLSEFRAEIDRWVDARDPNGRRMFAVPMATGSDCPEVRALDQLTMAQWLDQHQWDSDRLRWLVDYACRDDYGLSLDRTSAWAGIFYFAARVSAAGQESQSVITWPEGNSKVSNYLIECVSDQLRCGIAVCAVNPADDVEATGEDPATGSRRAKPSVIAMETSSRRMVGFRADKVIFAAPQMLAKYLVRSEGDQQQRAESESFQYGAWLVANVHLKDRPNEAGFPMCWDNVTYGSKSLGYVTSTHQSGVDYGPTVLTWYYAFAEDDPKITRQRMLKQSWSDWVDLVMSDLRVAHEDIDQYVTKVDVMLWGHAMVQPVQGFVWNQARIDAAKPLGSVHFAGTDLSGVALFEEALYHGIRAAEEVLTEQGYGFEPMQTRFNS